MENARQKKFDNDFRKAQTRTKIQLGGLLMKSGLTDFLDINGGDDLQLNNDKKDQAYILLGILSECYDSIKDETSLMHFLSRGKTIANS